MMISPESFRERYENSTLEECYKIRRELMNEMIEFEDNEDTEVHFLPSPETRYVINNLYLIEICRLIEKKLDEAGE